MSRAAALLSALALGACTYEKETGYKPFLSGIQGVQTQTPATADAGRARAGADAAAADGGIVIENRDGSVTLVSRSARHLMMHIARTLQRGERDLFTEQVLSDLTRDDYRLRGRDPREAFDALKARESDVLTLFRRMPLGGQSPGVITERLGPGLYRLKLTGAPARDLAWNSFDMSLEGARMVPLERDGRPVLDKKGRQVEVLQPSQWRLVWFGRD